MIGIGNVIYTTRQCWKPNRLTVRCENEYKRPQQSVAIDGANKFYSCGRKRKCDC